MALAVPERETKTPLAAHLGELRSRLIVIVVFFALFCAFGYLVHGQIERALLKPLGEGIFYSSITGGFEFLFNLIILIGAVLTLPIALYNLLRFLMPALPQDKRLSPGWFIFFSYVLILSSVAFTYYYALPTVLGFLSGFSTSSIKPLISTSEYLYFLKWYFVSFGVVFQIPLILLSINTFKALPMKLLVKAQKWVVLAGILFAMLLVPTYDIPKQMISALPIIVSYELSLLIIWIVNRRRSSDAAAPGVAEPVTEPDMPDFDPLASQVEAERLFKAGDYTQAKKIYSEIAKTSSNSAFVQNRLGVIYIKEKEFGQAEAVLLQAVRTDPTLASARANLGIVFIELGQLASARQTLIKALELKPASEKYRSLLTLVDKLEQRKNRRL